MKTLQLRSSVGEDGVLALRIPLGVEEAGHEVTVTIDSASVTGDDLAAADADWHRRLRDTYGACAGMGLERPDQGVLEERDPIE